MIPFFMQDLEKNGAALALGRGGAGGAASCWLLHLFFPSTVYSKLNRIWHYVAGGSAPRTLRARGRSTEIQILWKKSYHQKNTGNCRKDEQKSWISKFNITFFHSKWFLRSSWYRFVEANPIPASKKNPVLNFEKYFSFQSVLKTWKCEKLKLPERPTKKNKFRHTILRFFFHSK